MQDFRQLQVWEKSHQLVLQVYRVTQAFPANEIYGLTSQMRRASVSVPSNVAEGSGRGSDKDFARFVQIAIGSISELEYQTLLARDLGYINANTYNELAVQITEAKRMLIGLHKKLTANSQQLTANSPMTNTYSDKAALRGEPGYVWRSGQDRRLHMIQQWVQLDNAAILDNGCGLGTYLHAFAPFTARRFGLELEHDRAVKALPTAAGIVQSVGETLPFSANTFDFVFSNEVIEHVQDDAATAAEMVRVVKPGGRILIFCPNRWYPVEQHGIYWQGEYKFGNIPLVNYLPNVWRDKLAPHVRTYTKGKLLRLFADLPVRIIHHARIFGGYDNIENRHPKLGKALKTTLYTAEKTPLSVLGISHLLVLEKNEA